MTDQAKLAVLTDSPTADLTRAGGAVKSFARGGNVTDSTVKGVKITRFGGPVNRKNSVPWLAGASDTQTGYPVNIDYRVPRIMVVKGKSFPPDKYLVVHEIVEYGAMKKGVKYEPAHRKALRAEKASVEADGIDWAGYQEVMHRIAEGLEKAKHPNPPPNLFDKEYPCRLKEALHKEGVRSYKAGGLVQSFDPGGTVDSGYRDPTPDEMSQFGQPPTGTGQNDQDEYRDPTPDEMQQFGRRPGQPEISTLGAAGLGAARGVLPAAGAIPGAAAGAEFGAAAGALGGPAAPFTVPAGALAGGIGGAMLGGAAMNAVQNWLMDKLGIGEKVNELSRAAEEQHPYASMAGELAPNLAAFRPAQIAKSIGSRVVPASVGAGTEALNESQGDQGYDPTKIAMAGGAMALLNDPTKLGKGLLGAGERVSSAALSNLPQATQAAIAAGKARVGDYWGGKAQEGQPGRPDLKQLSAPPDYRAGNEGIEPYQSEPQVFNAAENPILASKAEQARPIYERPYKPRPGTSYDNNPQGPEDIPQKPKTPDTIDEDKRFATPAHGSPGVNASLATSHAMPAPNLNADVGNTVNPPAGSQRDYRATADSNVHPDSSGSGNAPTAEVTDPARHGITQEMDLALRPANENAPNAAPPVPSAEEGDAFNRSMMSQGVPSPESGQTAQVIPARQTARAEAPTIEHEGEPITRKRTGGSSKAIQGTTVEDRAWRQGNINKTRDARVQAALRDLDKGQGVRIADLIERSRDAGVTDKQIREVFPGAQDDDIVHAASKQIEAPTEHEGEFTGQLHDPNEPMQHVSEIAKANTSDMIAKTRQLGMNKLADAIEANPELADKVRPALSDPAQLRELSAAIQKAQQSERAMGATEKMQEGQAKRTPYIPEIERQPVAQGTNNVLEGEETRITASSRKSDLAKRAQDAAQSAFDKFATGKMGYDDKKGYSELFQRLRAAIAHATEQNLGSDPLLAPTSKRMLARNEANPAAERPIGGVIRKRTAAQEWLKGARDLVGTLENPKTILPSKAVKFLGDERMLLNGAKGKEIRASNRTEAGQPDTVKDWLDTLSPADRAEWDTARDENLKPPTDYGDVDHPSANAEEDRMIDTIDADRAARKSSFLDSASQFLENEDGSLNIQKLIQSVRGALGPRAQQTAQRALRNDDYYAARTATSPRQEYARSLDEGLMKVRNLDKETRIQNLKEMEAFPDQLKKPDVQEDLYFAHEAGNTGSLPPAVKKLYDQYLKPVFDKNERLYAAIDKLAPDSLGPKVKDHIYRIAKGLHPDYGGDPIAGDKPRGLSKTASMMKQRQFYAIEDPNGNRTVVSPTKTGYAEWNNGVQTFKPNGNFEAKTGTTFRDNNGVVQTVKDAMTPEIEANGRFSNGARAEYYHNAAISLYETHAYLSDVLRHLQFIESLKNDPNFKQWTTTDGKLGRERNWEQTKFPQLKNTYMANQLRWVFDDYAGRGFDDKSLNWARDLSERVTKTLFWNPVPHLVNVATHAFVNRGWKWVKPADYRTLAETTTQAIKSVLTQDATQTEIRNMRGNTPYGSIIANNFLHSAASIFGMNVASNPSKWDPIAKVLGMSTPDLARAIYRGSSKIMWAGNDMMVTQAYLENKANGMSPREAIVAAEKHIPNYRIPTSIMTGGSRPDGGEGFGRFMSKALRDPLVMAFGRYHYAIFNSYAHIVKSAVGPNVTGQERMDAVGKLMAMGMLGYAVYPLLDRFAQWATGNKDAEMHRRGPLSIPMQFWKDPGAAMKNTFTVPPLVQTAGETIANRDWAGRKVIQPGTWNRIKSGPNRAQAAGEAAVQEGEHAARGMVAPYGTAAQIADAKRNPAQGLRDQLLDIRNPSAGAARYERQEKTREAAAERSREQHGGHGPFERFYDKFTR